MSSEFLDELFEQFAAAEHERRSHWQRYLHGRARRNNDGSLTLPADLVRQWERLMQTPYSQLTEEERESNREQMRLYLPLLNEKWHRP